MVYIYVGGFLFRCEKGLMVVLGNVEGDSEMLNARLVRMYEMFRMFGNGNLLSRAGG